jgi:small-conductance mechanosensitive channel
MHYWRKRNGVRTFIAIMLVVCLEGGGARAQLPGLPGPAPAAKIDREPAKPSGAVAAPSGPITLQERVPDRTLQQFLARFLPKYPGVRRIKVGVDDGVVTLEGRVDDDDSRDEITDVVKRVEGVRLVLNQMKTDEELMTAWDFAAREINLIVSYFVHKWLLVLVALVLLALSILLARLFAAHADSLLAPFVRNVLLRSVVGSLISSLVVVGGVLLALSALQLTQAVLSILGLAGMVGLAVGFAFRDITENFIASVLLGVRRPFQVGDYVTIAGQSGVVKSLNTRATVLVTLEGNHVRIPNAVVFKEILINATASPSFRHSFDVLIPPEASTADAIAAIGRALREQDGVLSDPPPRAVVDDLESGGVRLKAYFWSPTRGVDLIQLTSDVKLKARVALQQAGVFPTAAANASSPARREGGAGHDSPPAAGRAAANLERDEHAAASSPSPVAPNGRRTPLEHILQQPETRVSEEGVNLLRESSAESRCESRGV